MLKLLNHPAIAILMLAGLLFFGKYCWDKEPGYTTAQVNSMDKLIAESDKPMTNAERMLYLYENK